MGPTQECNVSPVLVNPTGNNILHAWFMDSYVSLLPRNAFCCFCKGFPYFHGAVNELAVLTCLQSKDTPFCAGYENRYRPAPRVGLLETSTPVQPRIEKILGASRVTHPT